MLKLIKSVFCRSRNDIKQNSFRRYENYKSEVVDGVVKHTPSPVVLPALAESTSVVHNALVNKKDIPLRGRKVVDAVDLGTELDKIK